MSDETSQSPIKTSWLVGIALAFVLFVAIASYSARMTQDYSDYDQDRAAQRYDNLKKLQADENKQLNPVDKDGKPTAMWVDQDKGVISIPIEQAMTKEVDDLKAKVPGPGNEIHPPAPAPAPAAPAPAAAPSTNGAPAAPAAPAPPAAKPSASGTNAPAATPPAKSAKAPKTTFHEPAFKTRTISTTIVVRDRVNIEVTGHLIAEAPEPNL